MSVQENIRKLDSQGVPGREIARLLDVSRSSVAKYAGQQDFSPTPTPPAPAARPGGRVLTGFDHIIERWLTEDQRRNRKQRHTAKRIFDRLVDEHGFTGTYSPVQRYVKKWTALHRSAGEGFTELVWPAGTVQVDFGQAEAIIAGIRQVLHIFVVSFPFSNMRFVQGYRGETAECVAHGLRTVFEHIGAVPRHMVFDNATGIGNRVGIKVTETKLFAAFKLHYRNESRYCNPHSGHDYPEDSVIPSLGQNSYEDAEFDGSYSGYTPTTQTCATTRGYAPPALRQISGRHNSQTNVCSALVSREHH